MIFIISIYFISCTSRTKDTENTQMQLADSIIYADINGRRLDSLISIISQKGDSLKLMELSNKEQFLFVRYSNYGCKDCINFIVNTINKQNLNAKICFLIAEVPIQDLHVIQSIEKLQGAYRLDSFDIDFDCALTPYVFQINQKGEICQFYIPNEDFPYEFDQYLRKFQDSSI